jgi:hypothetical protein
MQNKIAPHNRFDAKKIKLKNCFNVFFIQAKP